MTDASPIAFSYERPAPFWSAIPGYFDYGDLYDNLTRTLKDGDVCVEIGCLLGRSSCYWGSKIYESGKKVSLICVDLWPASYLFDGCSGKINLEFPYDSFCANVRQSQLTGIIFPIRASSLVASKLVRNDLAAVFIDGDHSYESCREDILAWLPKIQKGGVIAGHDYSDTFPGVKRAAGEIFGSRLKTSSLQCWRVDL